MNLSMYESDSVAGFNLGRLELIGFKLQVKVTQFSLQIVPNAKVNSTLADF